MDRAKDIGANLKPGVPVLVVLLEQDREFEQLCPLASSEVTTNICVCAFHSTLKILFITELFIVFINIKNNHLLSVICAQKLANLQ